MNIKKGFLLIILMLLAFTLVGCNDDRNPENIVTKSSYNILVDTIYETPVYVFESNIEGPVFFISGGIHGDEIAGWNAALRLIDNYQDFKGTVVVIPRTNILATKLQKRYPGIGNSGLYDGIVYSDLNRSFPGDQNGTVTQQISYAIVQEVLKYNPDYIIDFHESLHSYATSTSRNLGDEVIYGNENSALKALEIVDHYNTHYKVEGYYDMIIDGNSPEGSFNKYLGTFFPDSYAFTFETSRELVLEVRITQQLNILQSIFDLIG